MSPPHPPADDPCDGWLAAELELSDDAPQDGPFAVTLATRVRVAPCLWDTFDVNGLVVAVGDSVICEGASHQLRGTVLDAPIRMVPKKRLPKILRRADSNPKATPRLCVSLAQKAREAARAGELPLTVLRAKPSDSANQTIVEFTARERISRRDFAAAIFAQSRERVELRHVPPREAARALGGMGTCGRELCCSTFLRSLVPVPASSARAHGISTQGERATGLCGKLLCCLLYEEDPRRGDATGPPVERERPT